MMGIRDFTSAFVALTLLAAADAAAAPVPPSAALIHDVFDPYGLGPPEPDAAVAPPQSLMMTILANAVASAPEEGIDLPNISYSVDGEVQTVPLPAAAPALLLALAALGLLARRWTVG